MNQVLIIFYSSGLNNYLFLLKMSQKVNKILDFAQKPDNLWKKIFKENVWLIFAQMQKNLRFFEP